MQVAGVRSHGIYIEYTKCVALQHHLLARKGYFSGIPVVHMVFGVNEHQEPRSFSSGVEKKVPRAAHLARSFF